VTEFQQQCYQTLKDKVPAGRVITYGGLAQLIGHPNAHRAVGSAMNKNPFAPKVPCHRVVKSNGELGGFALDLKIKIKRLQKEGVQVMNNKIVDFKEKVVKIT
jgi:methylated-DNA-[protein]-cysteine S-methyltransferase